LGGFTSIARLILTLSIVYDHLLGIGLSRTVEFGGYLSSLCSSFESLQRCEHPNIVLRCQHEAVVLDLDTVIPLGLIISELISNSYAHAFPERPGIISVSLSCNKSGEQATLTYSDDGAGYNGSVEGKRDGLRLVKRLMEQVTGLRAVHSDSGMEWRLTFPVPPSAPAVASIKAEP
jgi:two-component sensor histidine kinase